MDSFLVQMGRQQNCETSFPFLFTYLISFLLFMFPRFRAKDLFINSTSFLMRTTQLGTTGLGNSPARN